MEGGRIYTVEFENQSVSAQVDFFELAAADDKPIELVGLFLDQISDVGDAAEEMLRYRIIRGHTSGGSGGAAPTPQPLEPNDAAAGFAAETCNTTIASAGTAVNLLSGAFNIRAGLPIWFPPRMRPKTNQAAGLLVVRLMAAPADALTLSGTAWVREL